MKIVTWNVNSIRARLERAQAWLEKVKPDILCLQELKVTDEAFPADVFREAGYRCVTHGQKTYNGVAILSRAEPADVVRGMEDARDDSQARLITATVAGITVLSAYFPNGQAVGSDKYDYKLSWMNRLRDYLDRRFTPDTPLVLCGDFNVARFDDEVAHPETWAGSVLCHEDARAHLERIRTWGLEDVFRKHNPDGGIYSWWDYRMLAFPRNNGLRLDHIFATAPLANRSTAARVDRDERKGKKPSDHAPVIAEFED